MKRICMLLPTVVIALFGTQVNAQSINPCSLVQIGGTYQANSDSVCIGAPTPFPPHTQPTLSTRQSMNTELAAHAVSGLRELIAEVRGLREDLKAHAKNLADARTGFDSSTKATAAAQEVWRTQALAKVVDDLKKVPVLMAADPVLQTTLQGKLRADLADDATFIAALRTALAK
jgi:uncharacterized membrane protein YccC